MPEASRHAKPKPAALRLRVSILAAAALVGVAAAFVLLQGGSTAPKPARSAIPVTSTAAVLNGDSQENNVAVLRGVLQPVLDSMRDFQRWFKFPWEEQTLAQNEISDTQKMNTPDAQLTQNEL